MQSKWLKLWETPLKDTPALEGNEFDRRVAEFRKARGLAETFRLTTFCQVQRAYFVTVYERYAKDELFEPVRMERCDSSRTASGSSGTYFSVAVSDLGAWTCLCGRTGYVVCNCRQISCRPSDDGWCCEPGCGASGPLSPLSSVSGSKDSNSKALSAGARGPLLPRRS
jgi:hypothetical protein